MDNGADGIFLIMHGGGINKHQGLINIYTEVRKVYPNLYIGLNFLGLPADVAYKMLPEGA